MPIKTFRGVLTDGGQDTIVLHTNNGATGYRIKKFMILPESPGDVQQESIVQIWKVEQTSVPTTAGNIDFADNTLLGAGVGYYGAVASNNSQSQTIFFDNEVFNQDIYVTHTDNASNQKINYYIELEQIKLDLNENTVATLKDIRNIKSQ
jgi:hypothetical protein